MTILASSRARLGIQGETAYRLPSLSTIEARSLFIERARAANFGFTLSQADESTLAEVCGHLDGLPLAIELAASRTATLSVSQLRAMLNERFKLLSSGPRAEHQTLHATIDWSYNLLDGRDKELFGRLEVFAAAFTLEAAAAVCYEQKRDVFEVLDILGSLRKQIVSRRRGGWRREPLPALRITPRLRPREGRSVRRVWGAAREAPSICRRALRSGRCGLRVDPSDKSHCRDCLLAGRRPRCDRIRPLESKVDRGSKDIPLDALVGLPRAASRGSRRRSALRRRPR